MSSSASMMLSKIKTESESRLSEQKKVSERKKAILVFIQRHLQDAGYLNAATAVSRDTNLSLDSINTADNVDLPIIFSEFEQFYEMKYGKKPKFLAHGAHAGGAAASNSSILNSAGVPVASGKGALGGPPDGGGPRRLSTRAVKNPTGGGSTQPPQAPGSQVSAANHVPNDPATSSTSGGTPSAQSGGDQTESASTDPPNLNVVGQRAGAGGATSSAGDHFVNRVRKPMPLEYSYNSELRELATLIERDICVRNPGVSWRDIIGLERPKQLVSEAVLFPMKYPSLFRGILTPWRGILLFGPPGTGKTMVAKAVATECCVTFFNISASTIVSKWRGESEKLIRVLFDLAKHHAPSTIFIDELDSVMGARGGGDEHEGSRRLKTEILIQMDGLNSATSSNTTSTAVATGGGEKGAEEEPPQVFLLAASNLPWDLDAAMLRRLEKRILIPLPNAAARESLIRKNLAGRVKWIEQGGKRAGEKDGVGEGHESRHESQSYDEGNPKTNTATSTTSAGVGEDLLDPVGLSRILEGWSGADIRLLCKEIAMHPLRRTLARLESSSSASSSTVAAGSGAAAVKRGGSSNKEMNSKMDVQNAMNAAQMDELVVPQDIAQALARVRAAPLSCDLDKYEEWNRAFGST
ncbi:unnamed protein product [Amoebophrya sp. A25]|nr:unnamed protein product [Amoebophrya sp. A25]|eukprot:GSA25T00022470001.1